MRAQWDEGGRSILLSNNNGKGAVMLQLIRLQYTEYGFQLDSLVYTYIFDHINTQI
jgi:hypothetical protein